MIDKLRQLEENIRTLEKFKSGYTLKDIGTDKIDEWGLRYGIFESIQIIIDISCHIVSEKNLGTPKSYSDCIKLLKSNNILTEDTTEKLLRMTGLRNILIHEYGIVDIKKIFSYLDELEDFRNFVNQIKTYLI